MFLFSLSSCEMFFILLSNYVPLLLHKLVHTVKDSLLAFVPIHSSFCFTTLKEVFFPLCKSNYFTGVLDSIPVHFLRNFKLLTISTLCCISISFFWFLYISMYTCRRPSHHKTLSSIPPPTTTSFLFSVVELLRFFSMLFVVFFFLLIHSSTHRNLATLQKLHYVKGFHAATSNGHYSIFNLLDNT